MKSLVVYSSQTGNTQKLAESVYAVLPGEKEIWPVDEAPAPENFDVVAAGFWLQAGKPDPKAAAWQFFCMLKGEAHMRAQFGLEPLDAAEEDAYIDHCVRMFLRAYAT